MTNTTNAAHRRPPAGQQNFRCRRGLCRLLKSECQLNHEGERANRWARRFWSLTMIRSLAKAWPLCFGREGYSVVKSLSGKEARDYLSTEPAPDLILLDMMMPRHDGWQFLNQRKGSPSQAAIPVVIITALGIASPEWAASLGAGGLL